MTEPVLVLVAHGTRSTRGVETIAELAEAVSRSVADVRVAFVDVLGPTPSEVLRDEDGPVVVVPAFLASGFHVYSDVPREIAESGHARVCVTRALGPDVALAQVLRRRLEFVGWQPGDRIVLAAAGSSDVRALDDVHTAADQLATVTGSEVTVAYVATGQPRVVDVVPALRSASQGPVFVASYLLAPGLFHTRLLDAGADGVTDPLGIDDGVVALLVSRYRDGVDATSSSTSAATTRSLPGREDQHPG